MILCLMLMMVWVGAAWCEDVSRTSGLTRCSALLPGPVANGPSGEVEVTENLDSSPLEEVKNDRLQQTLPIRCPTPLPKRWADYKEPKSRTLTPAPESVNHALAEIEEDLFCGLITDGLAERILELDEEAIPQRFFDCYSHVWIQASLPLPLGVAFSDDFLAQYGRPMAKLSERAQERGAPRASRLLYRILVRYTDVILQRNQPTKKMIIESIEYRLGLGNVLCILASECYGEQRSNYNQQAFCSLREACDWALYIKDWSLSGTCFLSMSRASYFLDHHDSCGTILDAYIAAIPFSGFPKQIRDFQRFVRPSDMTKVQAFRRSAPHHTNQR